ncbi:MAG TPA: ribulose-phosphate 3-epimerase [Candidatus Binatia bacterium]|nr:ribulose-phosphate 3-epimerase [Candidatus Binatia bacterium]
MARHSPQIAPSILSADFARLGAQVEAALEAGIERIHIDVMDGHFVPNLSMGPQVVEALRPLAERFGAVLETHLMIAEPDRYLGEFARAGARVMTVHVEACPHLSRTVHHIRDLGAEPGVAVNPATPLGALEDILPEVDLALVMSVNPGFGGQSFIGSSVDKIARLRALLVARGLERVAIEVDGGVDANTIGPCARAGASILVAGSAIFNTRASIADNVAALHAALAAS